MNKIFALTLCAAALAGCHSASKLMPGSDRDAHGCIGSAGYKWSVVQSECIRVWQAGIELTDAQDPKSLYAAFVVLGADGSKAEIFLPSVEPQVLTRSFTQEGPVWTGASYRLLRLPLGWELWKGSALLYKAGNPPDASR